MNLIEKCFKPIILVLAVIWIFCAATSMLSAAELLIYAGVLSLLMGLRNLLILNISARTGEYHPKIQTYIDRCGQRTGIIRYAVMLVGCYLVLGLFLIVYNLILM